jgi:hypothetical protein
MEKFMRNSPFAFVLLVFIVASVVTSVFDMVTMTAMAAMGVNFEQGGGKLHVSLGGDTDASTESDADDNR